MTEDPSEGVVTGIEGVCDKVALSFVDLRLPFHGTTVVTNMILENTGARVGLLTSCGHEQVLHFARSWRPGPLYGWMMLESPPRPHRSGHGPPGLHRPRSPLGSDLGGPVEAIQKLLGAARQAKLPVVFTTVSYRESDKLTAAAFIAKVPVLLTVEAGSRWVEIDPRISPRNEEPVLNKLFASGLFGTGLSSLLTAAGVDTLIVTGASTSGCVRATVVDALQYGFRPVVPREAVGDRNPDAHEANLYDVDAKYGDVVSVPETLEYLEEISTACTHREDAARSTSSMW